MVMIAFDSHKHYTLASVQNQQGTIVQEEKIMHDRGNIQEFLKRWEPGTPVAVESIGSWYWIVDEIEAAGMQPRLVNPRKAKLMMGNINKTDRLDVRGLNQLQRNGTLPIVWIPPGKLRDERELPRIRMLMSNERTRLKNRIHSDIAKYGLQETFAEISDVFGKKGRVLLQKCMTLFPEHTAYTVKLLLEELEEIEKHIRQIEKQMQKTFTSTKEIQLLRSIPGIGFILGMVIWLEVGDVHRFAGPDCLANYAGVVPRIHSSGGKSRYGRQRSDTNHYLKWAFSEAANSIAIHRKSHPERHVSYLYSRVRQRRGHPIAVGAVARHLAEVTYWILMKHEPYKDPRFFKSLRGSISAYVCHESLRLEQ
jgi:transposase